MYISGATKYHTSPRNSHAPESPQGTTPPRSAADSRLLGEGGRALVRARRFDAPGEIQKETARRQVAGDDLHEIVDADARLLRGGRVAAGWPRTVPVAARRPARTRRADRRHCPRALA